LRRKDQRSRRADLQRLSEANAKLNAAIAAVAPRQIRGAEEQVERRDLDRFRALGQIPRDGLERKTSDGLCSARQRGPYTVEPPVNRFFEQTPWRRHLPNRHLHR
jgi:hypothetical protein